VGKNQVLEKIYAKQKVYVIVQDKGETDEEMLQIQLRTLDDDIKRMEADVKTKEARIKTIETAIKTTQNSMTREEVDAQMATLKTSVDALRAQAAILRDKGDGQMDPAEQKRVEQQFDKYSTAYRKRKRMCTNMIDMIMESYPKTKKQLVADVGIETDEDVGFVANTI
jgi:26S proteasome regulatory subunit, ATPase 3, interacting protein